MERAITQEEVQESCVRLLRALAEDPEGRAQIKGRFGLFSMFSTSRAVQLLGRARREWGASPISTIADETLALCA